MTSGPVLYKAVRAERLRGVKEQISMMNFRIHNEQTMKWQPCAAMHSLVCSLGVTASAAGNFGGRPGQISEDRRNSSEH